VSRDRRQRSKQRLRRRAGEGAGELVRADVPGALDHASGEVDEFDAALVRGAGGVPVPEADVEQAEASTERPAPASLTEPAQGGDSGDAGGGNGAVGNGGGDEGGSRSVATREPARPPEPRGSIFVRAAAFLRASWAELQRVQWPDRPEVFQATAVVMGFVAVMGVYLGVADWVAQKIINFVL
jgi:preprotein translocase subunit SecE